MPLRRITGRLVESALDQRAQRRDRRRLVRAVGGDPDRAALRRGQQQQAHDALAVHFALAARDADVRGEPAGGVDELRRRARVQARGR